MENLVEIKNNQVVVSSRQVAEKFGKEHRHVLEKICEIIKAENSAVTYFYESSYKAGTGKQYPQYLMNRDGFALLAMGFTGKEALQWKMKYIAAFNDMESQIKTKKPAKTELQEQRMKAMLLNAQSRQCKLWLQLAATTDLPDYKHICQQKAAEMLAGEPVLPMQEAEQKTYSATEIGKLLGVTAHKIGLLANKNSLKNETYGKYFYDKSAYSNKQVETFRYYPNAVDKFKELLGGAAK